MTTRVMVSFPEEFLSQIDRIAREENRSRSELLREAMRLYMSRREQRLPPGDIPAIQQAVAMQNKLAKISAGRDEDSTQDIRAWREARR